MLDKIIAIFGGSFNPPINSHIELAKQLVNSDMNIEKLIFVPVSTKYNKANLIEDIHRYNMLKLVCNKVSEFEVSDIELNSDKQLSTIQTLDLFKEKYKQYNICFIMGTDNLKEFSTWKNPKEILEKYKIIVLERENDKFEEIINNDKLLKENKDSLIKFDQIEKIYLSSSMIREKIKNKESVTEYFDKDVLNYINENSLYRN